MCKKKIGTECAKKKISIWNKMKLFSCLLTPLKMFVSPCHILGGIMKSDCFQEVMKYRSFCANKLHDVN